MGKSEHTFSLNDTVGTPREILDPIVEILGPIGLDPCFHPKAIVPARIAILLPEYGVGDRVLANGTHVFEGSGLDLPWGGFGLTFVNPPYSLLSKEPWIQKARDEADEAVLFLPVRTAGAWWQDEISRCGAVTFLRGRVTHIDAPTGAPFHQCLVYCGPRVEFWKHAARKRFGWTP